ncbi:MAG: PQQ-dependent sugar dehydrogenase [Methylacidiphilales bacterium]|nr:PQQ-dependent sugar dehydrogenase [Candidatus Methylacidiphilales bacterium]
MKSNHTVSLLVYILLNHTFVFSQIPTPQILEPISDGAVVSAFDVHMACAPFPGPANQFGGTDYEIWQASPQALVWKADAVTGLIAFHVHFGDGTFVGPLAGKNNLDPDRNYFVRMRFRNNQNIPGPWAQRNFKTAPLGEIQPLKITDILNTPLPQWLDSTDVPVILPQAASPHQLYVESCCGHTFLIISGSDGTINAITNPTPIALDKSVKVRIKAGSQPLQIPSSTIKFTDNQPVDRTLYLPSISLSANQEIAFWISEQGSSYKAVLGDTVPKFDELARGAAVPWTVTQPGYVIEKVATGFSLPVSIKFVPSPSNNPNAPFYYVAELYGNIKVVRRNGVISNYATNLLNFNPTGSFPGTGEIGVADLAIHPTTGDIYATVVYQDGVDAGGNPIFYGEVVRFTSTDGGLTAANKTRIFSTSPYRIAQSHQISAITFDNQNNLLVNVGDGFIPSTALNLEDARGKILRMTTTGAPVSSNPFYNIFNGITIRDYIYTYGHRNPFGSVWRRLTNTLYFTENGPNSNDRLGRALPGQSFGWNDTDISMTINALYNWVTPVAPVQLAFIESGVFNGSGFPPNKLNRLYVAESGPTFALGPANNGKRITEFLISPNGQLQEAPTVFAQYAGSGRSTACAIAAGPDGLYFSDLYAEDATPTTVSKPGANIFRIRFLGTADFSVNVTSGPPPLTVQFTDQSTMPGATQWFWEFGDGNTSTLQNPTHTYTTAGTFTVRLRVTGSNGVVQTKKAGLITVTTQKVALIVADSFTLNPAEEFVRQQLLSKNYVVNVVTDDLVTTADAQGKSLIYISSTVLSANVGNKFTNVTVPIICGESFLFDDLLMTGPTPNVNYGTLFNQTVGITSNNANDVLLTDVPKSSTVALTLAPSTFTWGNPIGNFVTSAWSTHNVAQAILFRFEKGATMASSFVAPARRLGIFLEDFTAQNLTEFGTRLLRNAIDWASNLVPTVSITSPASSQSFTTNTPVTINVNANDFDNPITKVEFLVNGQLIGEDTTAPYSFNWNASSEGTFTLTARATDAQEGIAVSSPITVIRRTPYNQWRFNTFNSAQANDSQVSGPSADPDQDGFPNLIEYASATLPQDASQIPILTPTMVMQSGQSYYAVSYTRSISATDVTITPEITSDLINGPWLSGPNHLTTVSTVNNGNGTETITVRDVTPSSSNGRRFFRLKIQLN